MTSLWFLPSTFFFFPFKLSWMLSAPGREGKVLTECLVYLDFMFWFSVDCCWQIITTCNRWCNTSRRRIRTPMTDHQMMKFGLVANSFILQKKIMKCRVNQSSESDERLTSRWFPPAHLFLFHAIFILIEIPLSLSTWTHPTIPTTHKNKNTQPRGNQKQKKYPTKNKKTKRADWRAADGDR